MKNCKTCNKIKDLSEFHKSSKAKDGRQSSCVECQSEYVAAWQKENADKTAAAGKRFKESNPQKYKDIHAKANSKWKKENPGKWNAIAANYRAAKLQATPSWLTTQHLEEIEEFYILAQELAWLNNGEIFDVDHIVPLQGKNLSGLHVPWNLQLLPKSINRSKKNKAA